MHFIQVGKWDFAKTIEKARISHSLQLYNTWIIVNTTWIIVNTTWIIVNTTWIIINTTWIIVNTTWIMFKRDPMLYTVL